MFMSVTSLGREANLQANFHLGFQDINYFSFLHLFHNCTSNGNKYNPERDKFSSSRLGATPFLEHRQENVVRVLNEKK